MNSQYFNQVSSMHIAMFNIVFFFKASAPAR